MPVARGRADGLAPAPSVAAAPPMPAPGGLSAHLAPERGHPPAPRRAMSDISSSGEAALFLSEYLPDLDIGSGFLNALPAESNARVRRAGRPVSLAKGEGLFFQGDEHTGVWVIEQGRIRTFYAAPTGRQITLAYWTPGHFVGGPEVFGGGQHIWSADALEPAELLFLSGPTLRSLAASDAQVALAVIDGLVAKGKCYSALIQMLGTRSVGERLQQLLVILAISTGRPSPEGIVIERTITYEQIATLLGATRQWVSQKLEALQSQGLIRLTRDQVIIRSLDALVATQDG